MRKGSSSDFGIKCHLEQYLTAIMQPYLYKREEANGACSHLLEGVANIFSMRYEGGKSIFPFLFCFLSPPPPLHMQSVGAFQNTLQISPIPLLHLLHEQVFTLAFISLNLLI